MSNLETYSSAKIIANSIGSNDIKLTTMEVVMPRYILPEFNTHRAFCLSGDSLIQFDKPSAVEVKRHDQIKYTLSDLYTMWQTDPEKVKQLCIRNVDETTGKVHWAKISEVMYSGVKTLFTIRTRKGHKLTCSADHRLLTSRGWQTLNSSNVLRHPSGLITFPSDLKVAITVGGAQIVFQKVSEIEYKGQEPSYDLSIDSKYHNFIANNIVCHNSRSSCSSRACPSWKKLLECLTVPVIPSFQKNQSGMQSSVDLSVEEQEEAEETWLQSRNYAIAHASILTDRTYIGKAESDAWKIIDDYIKLKCPDILTSVNKYRLHKQWVNRLLEPYMWHTVIVTATDWDNFFKLRYEKSSQPEIRIVARKMLEAYITSVPKNLSIGEYHLPYVQNDEKSRPIEDQIKISVASCARVSYMNHDGKRNFDKDVDLYQRLLDSKHMSPFEHVAIESNDTSYSGNFRGWTQFRKTLVDNTYSEINLEELLNNGL